jgi:hypothetical protein
MPVLGWFADDSGVVVPAAVLPLALSLAIAALAAVSQQEPRPGTAAPQPRQKPRQIPSRSANR